MNFGLNQPKKFDPACCRLSAALNLLAKLVTERTFARNTTVENIPPLDWIVENIQIIMLLINIVLFAQEINIQKH